MATHKRFFFPRLSVVFHFAEQTFVGENNAFGSSTNNWGCCSADQGRPLDSHRPGHRIFRFLENLQTNYGRGDASWPLSPLDVVNLDLFLVQEMNLGQL